MSRAPYATLLLLPLSGCGTVPSDYSMPNGIAVGNSGIWMTWFSFVIALGVLLLVFAGGILLVVFRMRHFGIRLIASIATLALSCSGIYFAGHVALAGTLEPTAKGAAEGSFVVNALSSSWPGAAVAIVAIVMIAYLSKSQDVAGSVNLAEEICEQRIRAKDLVRQLARTTKVRLFLRGVFEEYVVEGISPDDHADSRFPQWWRRLLLWYYDNHNHRYERGSFRNVLSYALAQFRSRSSEASVFLSQLSGEFSQRIQRNEQSESKLAAAIRNRIQ